jgi:polysaccharide deacetylase 2 family uncharacterized protein YibQ
LTQANPETSLNKSFWTGGYATLAAAYLVFFVIMGGIATWLLVAGPLPMPPAPTVEGQAPKPSSSEAAQTVPPAQETTSVAIGDNAEASKPAEAPSSTTPTTPQPAPQPQPQLAVRNNVESYDPDLVENSPHGKLPVVGPNGKTAWQTYAHPFNPSDDGPRLAIVIEDLGLNKDRTQDAIDKLPPEVTLAFSAYADKLQAWMDEARAAGHEVILGIPMEPVSYPDDDPGPDALLTTLSPQQNIDRLQDVLGKVTGYVGVINSMGSKFTASTTAITPVLQELSHRGLLLVDSSATRLSVAAKIARSMDIPRAVNNRYVDNEITADAIDGELAELEKVAQGYGAAVGIARPYPLSIERLQAWIPTLKAKGILIAPISAVVNKQPIR